MAALAIYYEFITQRLDRRKIPVFSGHRLRRSQRMLRHIVSERRP
jgi:hypothetical protein